MSVPRATLLLLVPALLLAATLTALAEAETLPVLRRKLLEAGTEQQVGYALDKLTAKIGKDGFYADHAAFGDWLGTLPDGKDAHPIVRLRRGWAYVRAKRGEEAIPHLEAALQNDPGDGLVRAYLGEALRQVKRYTEAAAMLAKAVECGERGQHVEESFRETIFALKASKISGHAEDLPEYVTAIQVWLQVKPDPMWHHTLARLLLQDYATFEKPDRERGKLWAETAGRHALLSFRTATGPIENQDVLAYDAAVALAELDGERGGRTDRFDLLAWALKFGRLPGDGGHKRPQVLTWLAEAAAEEERYELAFRLAQQRLAISDSPQVRRLLMTLPPDLEVEE